LAETGYVEGRNVAIEYRLAQGQNDRLPALAADLVRRQVAVIASPGSTAAALATKAATRTIPIVFVTGGDPVELGLVRALNRPGGNLTGATFLDVEVAAKRLELLHEVLPAAELIAVLVNPTNPGYSEVETKKLQVAARVLGVRLRVLNTSDPSEFEGAFATLGRERAGGLMVVGDALFNDHPDQLVALAARYSLPAMYSSREYMMAGGLMSYGASIIDAWHLAGTYTGRILNGEKAADLPVQQSTKVELIINLKIAKALGLAIPETLLATADEVIQ
jgi:putative tryptophan/tyrosine transport system substrate-binding protein